MGDMGDAFNDLKKFNQEKRANNRARSASLLDVEGIPYASKNGGAHLIVAGVVDFWPGTGKFIFRSSNRRGRGVRNLIKQLSTGDTGNE